MKKLLLIGMILLASCGGDENHSYSEERDRVTRSITPNANGLYYISERVGYPEVLVKYRWRGDIYTRDLHEFRYRIVSNGWMVRIPFNVIEVTYRRQP